MIPTLYQSTTVVCACGCRAPRLTQGDPAGLDEAAARGLAAQGWAGGRCPECCGRLPDARPLEQRAAEAIARFRGPA